MKKVLSIMVLFALIFFSACGTEAKTIEVKNGFIDISVEDFEKEFNALLPDEYTKAALQRVSSDGENSCYFCNLGNGIDLSVLATPDATMTYTAMLTLDMTAADYDAKKLGYYYSKVIYTVAPDITSEEIVDISEKIDMANPMPGDIDTTMRNNIIYALKVEDNALYLSVIANKQ